MTTSPSFALLPTEMEPVVIAGSGSISGINGGSKFVVYASSLDSSLLTANLETVLVENRTAVDFAANDFSVALGSRFNAATVGARSVVATMKAGRAKNIFHYDFNGGYSNLVGHAVAADSSCLLSWSGKWEHNVTTPVTNGNMRAGGAVLLSAKSDAQFNPMFFSTTFGKSLFHAGVGTVTAVVQPVAVDNRIIWCFGQPNDGLPGVALVVEETGFAVVEFEYGSGGSYGWCRTLLSISSVDKLTEEEHFVAVKFTGDGTMLRVDDRVATTSQVADVLFAGRKQGGLGCINFGSIGKYSNQPSGANGGCWLNDWQAYDAMLTDDELERIRRTFWPSGLSIILR